MKFAFVRPQGYSEWGGDLKALSDIEQGLKQLGHDVFVTSENIQALCADFIFFVGTLVDRAPDLSFMRLMQRDYGCIAFHEDHLLFSGPSFGFAYYVSGILDQNIEDGVSFSLDDLMERPHLIFYFDRMRPFQAMMNYEFLKEAKYIIANSHTEQKTLLRDAPGCNAKVVYWAAGHTGDLVEEPNDSFLRFAGVEKGNYILQVGRMMLRKNQLGTLLAAKDLDIPLVFIAMNNCEPSYEEIFFAAAAKWRKAPTILISQHLPSKTIGSLRIIGAPNGRILSKDLVLSAFANAGLHVHPAFYELPGYTYLESARFGVPTIASEWGSLKDYFTDFSSEPIAKLSASDKSMILSQSDKIAQKGDISGRYTFDDRIEYVLPYDISAIRKLIEKKFGQKYPRQPLHPIYKRKPVDVGRDFLKAMMKSRLYIDSIACLRWGANRFAL